jgi:hypothetical protein
MSGASAILVYASSLNSVTPGVVTKEVTEEEWLTKANLPGLEKDVELMASCLSETFGFKIVTTLEDKSTTKKSILDDLRRKMSEHAAVVFYFTGHGRRDGSGALLLEETQLKEAEWIFPSEVFDCCRGLSPNNDASPRLVVILDSCYSGVWVQVAQTHPANPIFAVIAATSARERTTAHPDGSPFTRALTKCQSVHRRPKSLASFLFWTTLSFPVTVPFLAGTVASSLNKALVGRAQPTSQAWCGEKESDREFEVCLKIGTGYLVLQSMLLMESQNSVSNWLNF